MLARHYKFTEEELDFIINYDIKYRLGGNLDAEEDEMNIAVLGWGSLVSQPRELRLAGKWMEGGPRLPIEFSRISDNGRLTLVIDERRGADVPTRYVRSAFGDLDEAITDLQKREGTPVRNRIGFIDIASGFTCERARANHPIACGRIQAWAEGQEFDAVVWTALGPRFQDKIGVPVDAAVGYLAGLREPTRTSAFDYILNAPADVATRVRKKVAELFGSLEIPTTINATH